MKIRANYINHSVEELFHNRGIVNIPHFVNPDSNDLQTFQDLENIDAAVRLLDCLNDNSHIGLIVDCDVDGFTSSSIIYQYLKLLWPKIDIEVFLHEGKAHGLEEHYGILIDRHYDLLIVPDAGTNDGIYAKDLTYPVLVIDHHLQEIEPSSNMTIVNNQLSSKYRNKNLSGAGMVFQVCRAMDAYLGNELAFYFIDLAALGICADMMSGASIENQYFWKTGFANVNNKFFAAIAQKQAYSLTGKMSPSWPTILRSLNPMSVAFYIVPLINAMIRMGTMAEKERLWLAFVDGGRLVESQKRGAKGELVPVAEESIRECTNAKAHQAKAKEEISSRMEMRINEYGLADNKILFILLEDEDKFPSELNGLTAMELSVKYHLPTIVARDNHEGFARGSIRGLSNSQLESFKNYLDSTGLCEYVQGHDNAAGISIPVQNIPRLLDRANIDLKDFQFGENYYDIDFSLHSMSDELQHIIFQIDQYKDVWSQGMNEPLIYIDDLHFNRQEIQIMGKNSDTVKIMKNGIAYMKFFAKDLIEEINNSEHNHFYMEVVGKAHLNEWNGTITPQIFIENYELHHDALLDF